MEIDERYMTPALMALRPHRRRFVMAMARNPTGTHSDWAREAGYSDHADGIRVRGHEAYHDPKVQAAVAEIAKLTLGIDGPLLAVHAVLNMIRDGKHPQHSKAVEMVLNRTGMGEKQQIEVVHRDLTGDALLERIRILADKHGVDLGNLSPAPKLIEGEVSRENGS